MDMPRTHHVFLRFPAHFLPTNLTWNLELERAAPKIYKTLTGTPGPISEKIDSTSMNRIISLPSRALVPAAQQPERQTPKQLPSRQRRKVDRGILHLILQELNSGTRSKELWLHVATMDIPIPSINLTIRMCWSGKFGGWTPLPRSFLIFSRKPIQDHPGISRNQKKHPRGATTHEHSAFCRLPVGDGHWKGWQHLAGGTCGSVWMVLGSEQKTCRFRYFFHFFRFVRRCWLERLQKTTTACRYNMENPMRPCPLERQPIETCTCVFWLFWWMDGLRWIGSIDGHG